MEAKLRDYDQDLQAIRAVMEQTGVTLQEKGAERDRRQIKTA